MGISSHNLRMVSFRASISSILLIAQALTEALYLALTAPDEYKAMKATHLAIEFAERLNDTEVEQCKLDALSMLESV